VGVQDKYSWVGNFQTLFSLNTEERIPGVRTIEVSYRVFYFNIRQLVSGISNMAFEIALP
jgi:hypothetical protein